MDISDVVPRIMNGASSCKCIMCVSQGVGHRKQQRQQRVKINSAIESSSSRLGLQVLNLNRLKYVWGFHAFIEGLLFPTIFPAPEFQ